ncbi:MAG: biopolymer transporter ExbD [Thermodesulfovibrionales bacterium]|nr:biopolymer transporter ExbD [Thermodesulfovibrionales bacterium]
MEHNKEFREMNVIPLVDVMLVLLTIVLTTATFIVAGEISVNLPQAENREARSNAPLFITITKDERVFLDRLELTPDELVSRLKEINKEKPIVIRADEDLAVRKIVFVIDALKGKGFKKVSMEVKEK